MGAESERSEEGRRLRKSGGSGKRHEGCAWWHWWRGWPAGGKAPAGARRMQRGVRRERVCAEVLRGGGLRRHAHELLPPPRDGEERSRNCLGEV